MSCTCGGRLPASNRKRAVIRRMTSADHASPELVYVTLPLFVLVVCDRCEELFLWPRLRPVWLLLLRLCVVACAVTRLLMAIKTAIRIVLILMPL